MGQEELGYRLVSMFENIRDLAFDEKICDVAKRFERETVTHFVFHQSLARFGLGKAVLVYPLFVRPGKLCVLKEVRRFPTRDLCPSFHRKPVHRQLVIDQRTFFNFKRRRRDDGKS